MDEDDQPKIIVKGWKDDAEIYLSVTDNGMGMRHEDVENILKDNQKGPKHGSGVGLINVHTRIQLMFGNKYGLIVENQMREQRSRFICLLCHTLRKIVKCLRLRGSQSEKRVNHEKNKNYFFVSRNLSWHITAVLCASDF